MKRTFRSFTFALPLTLLLFGCFGCKDQSLETDNVKQKPNIILIMTDDQGYGDIGYHGNPHIQTPNIDKLARESVRFTNFHVGTTCSPTRAGLMTGINCNRTGTWHTVLGRSLLTTRYPTIAKYLQEGGYHTGIFGKWHLGDNYPFRPQDRGFDEVLIHGGGGVGQTPDYWNNDYFDDTYFDNGEPKKYEGYCTDIWFQGAIEFLEKQTGEEEPFFCYLVTNAPHGPFHVPQKYIDLYKDNNDIPNPNFYGMISNIDENLGKLDAALDRLNLKENTLLIFMTDNGTAAGVKLDKEGHVVKGYNAGMRGLKGWEYEGGHRVPLFMRFPSGTKIPQKEYSELVTHTDLVPTLLEYCTLEPESTPDFDGMSLMTLLTSGQEPVLMDRIMITDTQRKEFPTKWKDASVMQNNWRLINNVELYDLTSDPGQTINIIKAHPEKAKQLEAAYEAWWTKIEPEFHLDNRIIVGSEVANPTTITSHDWHGERNPPWHQRHIREGVEDNGYWMLDVAKPGNYRIRLFRWPPHLELAFADKVNQGDVVSGGNPFPPGVGLNTKSAKIKIQDKELMVDQLSETSYDFSVTLEKGPSEFQTWCFGQDESIRGAYYAQFELID